MKLYQFNVLWQKWLFKYNIPFNYYNHVTLNFDFEPLFQSLNTLEITLENEKHLQTQHN
jgi:hypothetical protein